MCDNFNFNYNLIFLFKTRPTLSWNYFFIFVGTRGNVRGSILQEPFSANNDQYLESTGTNIRVKVSVLLLNGHRAFKETFTLISLFASCTSPLKFSRGSAYNTGCHRDSQAPAFRTVLYIFKSKMKTLWALFTGSRALTCAPLLNAGEALPYSKPIIRSHSQQLLLPRKKPQLSA